MPNMIVLLCILFFTLIGIVSNRIRLDLLGVIIIITLGAFHITKQEDLFSGFSSEAVIVIASMLAIGEALVISGVTDRFAGFIAHFSGKSEKRLLIILMLVCGILSPFINDLAVVSIFMPVVFSFAISGDVHVNRLLLPVALASMLGGMMTMVGSSSSIVVNQILEQAHIPPLPLFSVAPLGIVFLLTGILSIALFDQWLLPAPSDASRTESGIFGITDYLTEIEIPDTSSWIGKTLAEISFLKEHGILVNRILRRQPVLSPSANTVIHQGDILLVQAHRDDLLKLRPSNDFNVQSQVLRSMEETKIDWAGEVIVRRGSALIGKTLAQVHFRQKYDAAVLAIWRNGTMITQRLATIRLMTGDMLLIQGSTQTIEKLGDDHAFLIVTQLPHKPNTRSKGRIAVGVLILVFLLVLFHVLPIAVASMLGVAILVVTNIISATQVYGAIDWKVIIFIAAMIPLTTAMKDTGLMNVMSGGLIQLFQNLSPQLMIATCFCLAAILTQIFSNTPTVLLLTPVVIETSVHLHLSPIPFVVTILAGVTASPVTYISHKVFLLIMGPGGYRFRDYIRVGVPMTILFFILTILFVPILWPIHLQ